MTERSVGQNWALDIALAQGGFNALHPAAKGTMEQLGHDQTDFDKVFALVQSGAMLPKAWATIAGQAEQRAHHHESHGYRQTAADLYLRAAVMWGVGPSIRSSRRTTRARPLSANVATTAWLDWANYATTAFAAWSSSSRASTSMPCCTCRQARSATRRPSSSVPEWT
ncbi:hypothetical protein AB0C34_15340 [Nocardia sp. NPDC049220]|uniref:hypothetical protein n=1 Tax=Nocardia sp. NPDC049220 TaxID=3155273 RepID=UPI0033F5C8B4